VRARTGLFPLAALALALSARPARAETTPRALEPPPLEVHHAPLPDGELGYREVMPQLTPAWFVFQLVPSPELAFGRERHIDPTGAVDKSIHTDFGLRWELTPFLWSFGVHRKQVRWRSFVVDPIARQSGSLELSTGIEYIAGDVNAVILRPGLRVYLPVAQRGEYVSVSLGTSAYRFDGLRVAYDAGVYFLSGFLGFQVTVAPTHAPLAAITTFRIRYF
jgi:hypothetical protein